VFGLLCLINNIPTKYIDIFCVAVLLLLPTSLRHDRSGFYFCAGCKTCGSEVWVKTAQVYNLLFTYGKNTTTLRYKCWL